MLIRKSLAVGALALTLPLSVMAASDFKVNGFSTVQLSATDTDEMYVQTDKDGTFNEGTLLGLQMRFAPNNDVPLSFVTQLLSRAQNQWSVDADWAYINWKVSEEFNVNVGRVKLPIFLISEAYDVGITYPWIRPPEELYGFGNVPMTALTGLSLDYRKYFDETWVRGQFYYGRDKVAVPALGIVIDGEITHMTGVVFSTGTENLEVRLGYHDVGVVMDLTSQLSSLPAAQTLQAQIGQSVLEATAALAGADAQLAGANAQINGLEAAMIPYGGYAGAPAPLQAQYMAAVNSLTTYGAAVLTAGNDLAAAGAQAAALGQVFGSIPSGDGTAKFKNIGLRYDDGTYMLISEVGDRPIGGIPFPDTLAGFVTVGMHMGKVLPHFTYSAVESENSNLSNQSQESYILGVRYDVQPWAALKMEYQYTELGDAQMRDPSSPLVTVMGAPVLTSTGLFNVVPDLTTFNSDVPDSLNKLSMSLTMVF